MKVRMPSFKFALLFGLTIVCSHVAVALDAGSVEGTDSADAITVGSTNISSDNSLTYNDGTGDQTGVATSSYTTFSGNGATPINLDAQGGADTITVNGFGATEINIDGGSGYNTITVSTGATLIGNINGGSESPTTSDSNSITINGTLLGDVGHGSVTAKGTDTAGIFIQGSVGWIDGEYRPAYNVDLQYVTIGNASGNAEGVSALGQIQISNANINGKIDNRLSPTEAGIIIDNAGSSEILSRGPIQLQQAGATIISNIESSSQAPITITQGGGGAILSRGVITIDEAGSGAMENLQLEPDADNPGIYVTLGGGGDISSDGPVQIDSGGAGSVMSSDATLGDGGNAAAIIGRDIEALDYVDKATLKSGASAEAITLGDGNDFFTTEDLANTTLTGIGDGGDGEADLFTASGFEVSELGLFFQSEGIVIYLGDDITAGFSLTKFETYQLNDDVTSSEAETYGEALALIFFDPEFSDPMTDLLVYINGTLSSESALSAFALPTDGSTTQFTFTGDNPVNGNPLEFDIYATVPEPGAATWLLLLSAGGVALMRRKKNHEA